MTTTDPRLTELPKAYDPSLVEGLLYQRWLDAEVFAPDGKGSTADPSLPPFVLGQQRRLGLARDWGRLRMTIDVVSARAVRESFARLYRDGLAYRTEALVNWCPGCMTSVSDLEVIPTEERGTLWTIRYHLIDE